MHTVHHIMASTRKMRAMAVVIGLLVTCMVPITSHFEARADSNDLAEGALCTPTQGTIGDSTSSAVHNDSGIATWVGRDMYIGAPSQSGPHYTSENMPEPSYAVEAEGLTAVAGRLAMRGIKQGWHTHGFRFGVVGFGAMMTPKGGSDALVVAGKNTAITLEAGVDKNIASDADTKNANVLSWGDSGRAYVRADSFGPAHYARIQGVAPNHTYKPSTNSAEGKILGTPSTGHHLSDGLDDVNGANPDDKDVSYSAYNSVRVFDDPRSNGQWPGSEWGYTNWRPAGTEVLKEVLLNGKPEQDISDTTQHIQDLSQALKNFHSIAEAVVGYDDVAQPYERAKYNDSNYKVAFTINPRQEKIISFTGNNTSSMQVFNLPAHHLQQEAGVNGISFSFNDIPEGASVVVNVTGNENQNIEFNHGWRFWWNGQEIGNYFAVNDSAEQKERNKLYSTAASSILWNFADLSSGHKLAVKGGQITADQKGTVSRTYWDNGQQRNVTKTMHIGWSDGSEANDYNTGHGGEITDDPVANMLGSVLVPYGSFESHVSTNGRVWVGEDFMMYNPIGLDGYAWLHGTQEDNWKGVTSASVIEQDQERHNFSWLGSVTRECSSIEWKKLGDEQDANGNTVMLKDTKWGIYGTLENARTKQNVLREVKDNDFHTGDYHYDEEGFFHTRGLKPNATYFIRELESPKGYELNPNIYQINTPKDMSDNWSIDTSDHTSSTIVAVYGPQPETEEDPKYTQIWKTGEAIPNDEDFGILLRDVTLQYTDGREERFVAIKNKRLSELSWGKYHATDANGEKIPLSGTTWRVTRMKDSNPDEEAWSKLVVDWVTAHPENPDDRPAIKNELKELVDEDPSGGHISIFDLKPGKYYVQEQSAPEGYWLNTNKFEAQIQRGVKTLLTDDYWINDEITVMRWNKVNVTDPFKTEGDQQTVKGLAGSEWNIERFDTTKQQYVPVTKEPSTAARESEQRAEPVVIKDCIAGQQEHCHSRAAAHWSIDADDTPGSFALEGIPVGMYRIQEKTAPAGYNLVEGYFYFEVQSSKAEEHKTKASKTQTGNYVWLRPSNAAMFDKRGYPVTKDDSFVFKASGQNNLLIGNESGVKLPEAGSTGAPAWPLWTGIGLVLTTLLGMYVFLRKQEQQQ